MTIPQLLSNRYELGETLGYGGMSEVHKGRDVRLGRDVAVKVLRADLARDPQFQERFRREAQNAAALNHPAIVAVYDTGETQTEYGPLPYIVMEYVDGRTLRDIVKTEGALGGKRAMEIMADVCAALDFSHRNAIVHRDVKPANVMITQTGAVKVMDFGIARALHDGQAAVTQTAAVIGTAQYLSPEQARGESVDARSDVYSAGCVLFELVTAEPPFTGDSPVAVAYQHVREDPQPPSHLNEAVPPQLDAIVLKALAKNPANRYQSAAEMRSDLVRVLSGQRPSAPAVFTDADRTSIMAGDRPTEMENEPYDDEDYDPEYEEELRDRRRKRWIIAAIVAGCLILIALVAWLTTSMLSGGDSTAGKTTVPAGLKGQQQSTAIQELAKAHLKPNIKKVPCQPNLATGKQASCTTKQINHVLRTNPASGTQVKRDSVVTLWIGSAPEKVGVPDLKGMSPDEAKDALKSQDLKYATAGEPKVVDDPDLVGKVVSSDPSSDEQIAKGETVTVTLGKKPDLVTLQDYTNQTKDQATSNLKSLGFQVEVQTQDSPEKKGTVIGQNPPGGSQVKPDSTVTLTVSKGNQIEMPDLTGDTKEQAMQDMSNAGWAGDIKTEEQKTTDPSKNGKVLKSNPSAGTTITKDQAVIIYVGKLGIPDGGPTH